MELYYNGLYNYYVTHDYAKAIDRYTEAIKSGNAYAMCGLACYYDEIEKNFDKAIEYYTMGINHGGTDSSCNIGYLYEYDILPRDEELVMSHYMTAYNKGSVLAIDHIYGYYQRTGNAELMMKYYYEIILHNFSPSIIQCGDYYRDNADYTMMMRCYTDALSKYNKYSNSLIEWLDEMIDIIVDLYQEGLVDVNYDQLDQMVRSHGGIETIDRFEKKYYGLIRKIQNYGQHNVGECLVCKDNKKLLLLDCLHVEHRVCVDCLLKINQCPMCRCKLNTDFSLN
jgi:tetratricopeptide (TPR) repeat protein